MKSIVAATVIVAATATANAQPSMVQPRYAQPAALTDQVSEDTAVALSLGGTAASWGMLILGANLDNGTLGTIGAFGTLLAPSFGHWYAHDGLTRGLGVRVLGLGAATIGLSMALDGIFDENANHNDGTGAALMLVGAGLYIVGTIDDIATAPSAARKYNARFDNVSLIPTMNQHGGGFAVMGRF